MIEQNFDELKYYDGPDRIVTLTELRAYIQANKKTSFRCATGISQLDSIVGGLRGGQLIIISGRTKMGKTTLLYTLNRNLNKQNVGCLWFSLEMPPDEFLDQIGDVEAYTPLTAPSADMSWVFRRYFEARLKYNPQIVFIDHLHYLIDMFKSRNPAIDLGMAVRNIKRMAIDWNIVVFLVCHITKIPPDRDANETDLRDSGLIACEADSTWMVKRQFKDNIATNNARLTVCNHRATGAMGRSIDLIKIDRYLEPAIPEEGL